MKQPEFDDLRNHLAALHRSAIAAADPEAAVRRHLSCDQDHLRVGEHSRRLDPAGRVLLVAFGKASLAMARGAMAVMGNRVSRGIVVHSEGVAADQGCPPAIQFVEGGHPRPTEGSLEAGRRVAAMLRGLLPTDVVLVLVSGGGSAMLEMLPPGLALSDLDRLTAALQDTGADIHELNTVRRSLSLLKGGGLARLAGPASTIALLLSDVLGDLPEAIASGPTVPSPTGTADALRVLARYDLLERFAGVARVIERARGEREPSPPAVYAIVGSNREAANGLAEEAARLGFRPLILTTHLQGEAREVGRLIGGLAWSVRRHSLPLGPPACLVLGGETTVTKSGHGKGGRNQELVLGATLTLEGCERAAVFSFATDGVDGNSGAAGAFATGRSLGKARALGLSVEQAFQESDTGSFFERLGDLWVTGPSGTNVNDLTVVLVYG
jgi:glycerate 2-kinase